MTGWGTIFRSEGERVYEVGCIVLVPHVFLSSCRRFRRTGLVRSRIPRVYAGLSEEQGTDIGRRTLSK